MCNMTVLVTLKEQFPGAIGWKTDGRQPIRGEKRNQSWSTDDCLERFYSKGEQKNWGAAGGEGRAKKKSKMGEIIGLHTVGMIL